MLPTVGGKHHEEMLGPESRQASGDGGGSEATRGSRHKQRRGNDTTRQVSGVPLFLQTSWPLISLSLSLSLSPLADMLESCVIFFLNFCFG